MALDHDHAGEVLDGRYRLGPVIGRGGMATVRRGWHERAGIDIAVKLFEPVADPDDLSGPQVEATALTRVHHAGLVELIDVGRRRLADGTWQMYLVLELVAGPSLTARLRNGPLAPGEAASLGRAAAEALSAVHDAGIVHRDVKPGNLLLTGDEQVLKVADFGIARMLEATRRTMTGTTLGTASYLSPEQASGVQVRTPSDVYSLGLVLLECLTGEKAFTGTVPEVAAARLVRDPDVPASLPPDWASLLRAMTARDPGVRPSATEVGMLLADLAVRSPEPGSPAPVLEEMTLPVGDGLAAAEARVGVVEGLVHLRRQFEDLGLPDDRRAVVDAALGLLDDEVRRHATGGSA
ncbi:serine/threonine protein kinase [Actinotalea sp. M2MS4P-6]|uniref:serine/threonine-protein kinase n=1 Tax=Actinotalea sp. M2MS4P-6 TaxID=2983762 RepID=UPI0021E44E80|nr:serine/threonine-protein kinase [Actinotalea sp. M2MS4P-6]MCV2394701.1 serine/threonine protein kinase [Actinotalea sp. M2MS4P-6]